LPRGLDHIVHAVHDLDAAASFYRRAGFTVGARNRHPWGTHNYIVQFPGVFVELVSVGEPGLIPPSGPRVFSFGAYIRDFLSRSEGLSMLVLEGKGAAADADAFRAAGIGDFEVFDFARETRRPDGTTVKVAFSLVFATDPHTPDVGYFTCQQHFPENFWNPAFQSHPNAAKGVAGVVIVAKNPADHGDFLKAFSGASDLTPTSGGITIKTPRGEITVLNPTAFRLAFGVEPPDVADSARLAAIRFSLPERQGSLIVPPDEAFGATLIFEGPN
jgi:hypothetical protein